MFHRRTPKFFHLVIINYGLRNCLGPSEIQALRRELRAELSSRDIALLGLDGGGDHFHLLVERPPHHKLEEFLAAVDRSLDVVRERVTQGRYLDRFRFTFALRRAHLPGEMRLLRRQRKPGRRRHLHRELEQLARRAGRRGLAFLWTERAEMPLVDLADPATADRSQAIVEGLEAAVWPAVVAGLR
jgi:REP element-mobilizing transposase RayT